MNKKVPIVAGVILLGIFCFRFYQASQMHDHYDTDVHVHSDFAAYINDTKLDFSQPKYQSSLSGGELDKNVHLHDGNGSVIHRHADGITLAYFFHTLGFTLTNDCFTTDASTTTCSDEKNEVALYVNNQKQTNNTTYINQERDRILLYVGPRNNPNLQTYLNSVTDEACIPSGTCPERGHPVVETCGLTCDLKVTYVDHSTKEILTYVFLNHF
jgi:hypothetical protein